MSVSTAIIAETERVSAPNYHPLPIVVSLIIIAIIFQTQNDRFLTAGNFVNLIVQSAPYAVIAMGVTFALLLGEIDLSIGFVSGVGGVLTAILLTPDGNELPTFIVFVIVLGAGLAIGTFHGLIITKIGVPSFVVTLAGLLAWNGVVLLLIGSRGTVILQNDFVIGIANDFLAPGAAWILAAVCVALTYRPGNKLAVGAAGTLLAGLVAAYALAITVGVPVLHPDPEPADGLGLVTKAIELVGLAAALQLTLPGRSAGRLTRLQPKGTR